MILPTEDLLILGRKIATTMKQFINRVMMHELPMDKVLSTTK